MYLYTSIAPLWGHVCVLDYLSIYYAQKVCCATISQLSLPTICDINLLYPHPDIVQCSLGISGSVRAAKLARHSHDKRMYICIYIYIYIRKSGHQVAGALLTDLCSHNKTWALQIDLWMGERANNCRNTTILSIQARRTSAGWKTFNFLNVFADRELDAFDTQRT